MDIEIEKEKNRIQEKDKQMIENKISQQTESNGEIAFIMPNSLYDDNLSQLNQGQDLSFEIVKRIYDWNLILNNKKLIRKYYPLLQSQENIFPKDQQNIMQVEQELFDFDEKSYAQMIKFSSDEILEGLQSVTILAKQLTYNENQSGMQKLHEHSNTVLKSLNLIDNFDLQESTNSVKSDIKITYISIGDPFNSNDDEYLRCLQQKKGQVQHIQFVPHFDFKEFTNQPKTQYFNSSSYTFIQHSNINMPSNSFIFLINKQFEETVTILFETHIKRIIKDFKSKLCILTYDASNYAKILRNADGGFDTLLGQIVRKVSRIFQNQLIIVPQIYPSCPSQDISFQQFQEFQIKLFMNYKIFLNQNQGQMLKWMIKFLTKYRFYATTKNQIKFQVPKTQLHILRTYQELTEESKVQLQEESEDSEEESQQYSQQENQEKSKKQKKLSFIYLLRKNYPDQLQNANEDTFRLDLDLDLPIQDDTIIQIDYQNEKILIVLFQEDNSTINLLKFTFNENKYQTLWSVQTKFTKEDVFYLSDQKIYIFGYVEQQYQWMPTLTVYENDKQYPLQYKLQEAQDKVDKYFLNGARKYDYSVIKSNLLTKNEPNYTYFIVVGGTYQREIMYHSGVDFNSKNQSGSKTHDTNNLGYQYNCTFEQIKINDQNKIFERQIIDKQKFYSPSGQSISIKESLNPYLIYATPQSFYYIENKGNYDNFAKEPAIYQVQAIQPKIIITKYTMDQKYTRAFTQLYYNMNPNVRNYWLTNLNLRLDLVNIYNSCKRSEASNPLLLGQRQVRVCSNFTFNFKIQSGNFTVDVEYKTQQYELNLPQKKIYKSFRYKNWIEQIKDTYIYYGEQKQQYIVFYKSLNKLKNDEKQKQYAWTYKTFIFQLDPEIKSIYQDFDEVVCHDVDQNALFVVRKYYPCEKGSFKLFYCLCSNFQDLKEQDSNISLQIDLTLLNTSKQEYGDYSNLLINACVDSKHLYLKFDDSLVIFNKNITKKDQKFYIEIQQIFKSNNEILRQMNFKEATQMFCQGNNLLIYYERAQIRFYDEKVQGVFNYLLVKSEQQNLKHSKQQIIFDLSLYQKHQITKIQLKINNIQIQEDNTFKVNILEYYEGAVQIRYQYIKLEEQQLVLVKPSKNGKKYESLNYFTSIPSNRMESSSICINNKDYKRLII
ncbi:hypothetical protein pb186bvf_001064 [Paramecium bursaria]